MKLNRILALSLLILLAACHPDDVIAPVDVTAPEGVSLDSYDSASLTFVWDEVSGADYYVGRLEKVNGELVAGGQTTTKTNSLTYKGLESDTEYMFKVKAKAGSLESPYSEAVSARTAAGQEPGPSANYDSFKIPSHEDEHGKTLAFPGAEGGGMYVTGIR